MAYQLSFAGAPFRIPSAADVALVERYRLLDQIAVVDPRFQVGRSLLALAWPHVEQYKPRLGEFYYPTGASRFGIFNGLATGNDVATMQNAVGPSPATSLIKSAPFIMQNDGLGGAQLISTPMFLLPPRPLNVVKGDPTGGLFLVTLVDERWVKRFISNAQQTLVCTCSDFTGTSTWADLWNFVAGTWAGYTTIDTISPAAAYGQPEPDSPLYQNDEPQSILVDAIAANVGGFLYRRMDGTYGFQTWNAALPATKAARLTIQQLCGGAIFNPDTSVFDKFRALLLPNKVSVRFPMWINKVGYYRAEMFRSHYETGWAYGDTYNVDVVPTDLGGYYAANIYASSNEQRTKVIRTTAKAIGAFEDAAQPGWTGGTNWLNSFAPLTDDSTNLAKQLAKDYYDCELAALDEVYEGIQPWPSNTGHDVIYTWTADVVTTRVFRRPFDTAPAEFQHGFGPQASDFPRWVPAPGSTNNPSGIGYPGQMAYDSHYLYVCTATDTWQVVGIISGIEAPSLMPSGTDQAGNTVVRGQITVIGTDGFTGSGGFTNFTFANGRCTFAE